MICPRCQQTVSDGPECAACGVVVAKFMERREKAPEPEQQSTTFQSNQTTTQSVSKPRSAVRRLSLRDRINLTGQFEQVLGGASDHMQQIMKELGVDGGADIEKLMKELGQPAGASRLPPELEEILKP